MTSLLWAELSQYLNGGFTVKVMRGTVTGQDDDGEDVIGNVRVLNHIDLADEDDETWIKALTHLGYRHLPDTVNYTENVIKFELRKKAN